MDIGTWWTTVYGVAKNQTWLSDWAHNILPYLLGIFFQLIFFNMKLCFMCILVFIVLCSVHSATLYYKIFQTYNEVEHVFYLIHKDFPPRFYCNYFTILPSHPSGSSSTHKFLARLDVHFTFVWVLTAVGFCIPPLGFIPWYFLSWPSFTQYDDQYIYLYLWRLPLSYFNPWFIIHSRPVSHFSIHSSV